MAPISTRRRASTAFGAVAIIAVGLLAATATFAAESFDTGEAAREAISISTSDPAARTGAPAMMLRQIARKTGQVRVIVGLRLALRMEDTLSQAEADSQQRSLRATQDAVVARVLGSASAPGVDRFTFIPYMSLLVDAAQLDRLLADPQVVSIYEDVPERNLLNESIPLTPHRQDLGKGIHRDGLRDRHPRQRCRQDPSDAQGQGPIRGLLFDR